MKKFIQCIGAFIISVIIAGFLMISTMVFGQESKKSDSPKNSNYIGFSLANIKGEGISYSEEKDSQKITQENIVYANFGRLSSAFLMPNFKNVSTDASKVITKNANNLTIGDVRSIFSWYDPFEKFVLTDVKKTFKLTQITNGSLYFGYEDDNTVTIYSLDLVAKLTFLHQNEEMTSMIIFPGMYLRFDPNQNRVLKNADLFRIIQTLGHETDLMKGSIKAQTTDKNTGIEFIDARAIGNENNPIRIFRLATDTQKMFQLLSRFYEEKIKAVDELKSYSQKSNNKGVVLTEENAVLNPTKNTYLLLDEMRLIFSKALDEKTKMTEEEFRKSIVTTIEKAKSFGFEKEAKAVVEQFLIDARFALFVNDAVSAAKYQLLYESAAKILSIQPETGKGKLFQLLSNIFSHNLTEKNRDNNISMRMSTTLQNTLSQSGIDTNDYFDIAMYQFLILERMLDVNNDEHRNQIPRLVLENPTLYQMYTTIIDASQKYVDGLENSDLRSNTQRVLAGKFYTNMLELLLVSLYGEYTEVREGQIFLKSAYVNELSEPFIAANHGEIVEYLKMARDNMKKVYNQKVSPIYTYRDVSQKLIFESFLIYLDGIVDVLFSKDYKEYQNRPYDANNDGSRYSLLPKYDAINRVIMRTNIVQTNVDKKVLENDSYEDINKKDSLNLKNNSSQKDEKMVNLDINSAINGDNNIINKKEEIRTLLSNILGLESPLNENQMLEHVNGYEIKIIQNGLPVHFIYNSQTGKIIDMNIIATTGRIRFDGELQPIQLRGIFAILPTYQSKIAQYIKQNPQLAGKEMVISFAQKTLKIDENILPL